MREYRNRNTRTNDEESDPCIAAEIRMKKSLLTTRARRNLLALLIILGLIASLSVLLFLIIPRSQKASEEAEYKGYDVFKVPSETTTVSSLSPAAVFYAEGDVVSDSAPVLVPSERRFDTASAIPDSTTASGDFPNLEEHPIKNHKVGMLGDTEISFVTAVLTSNTEVPVSNEVGISQPFINQKTFIATTTTISEITVNLSEINSSVTTTDNDGSLVTQSTKSTDSERSIVRLQTIPFKDLEKSDTLTASTSMSSVNEKSTSPSAVDAVTKSEEKFFPDQYFTTTKLVQDSMQNTTLSQSSFSNENVSQLDALKTGLFTTSLKSVTQNCQDLFLHGERRNGIYRVFLSGTGESEIVCDMTSSGGGWNVIQRRYDGTVDFENRSWDEYERGFGDLDGSFWLGLKKIHSIVAEGKGKPLILRIEIHGDRCNDGTKCSQLPEGFWFGEWEFKISDSKENYTLWLSPAKSGNLSEHSKKDKFYYMNNGQQFTTIDRDNDRRITENCASLRKYGGWWHNDCGYVALNGRYDDTGSKMKHLFWQFSRTDSRQQTVTYNIKPRHTEMKIRL